MATNYSRGADFERRVMKLLEDRGYFCVRSAGSHGAVDIVAMRGPVMGGPPGWRLLIQCKRHGVISPADRAQFVELAQSLYCAPVLARMPKGKKRGIELLRVSDESPSEWEEFEP